MLLIHRTISRGAPKGLGVRTRLSFSPSIKAIPHRCFSSSKSDNATVELSYEVLEPAAYSRPNSSKQTEPILFLHGLFGSKKNNRSVSKVLARDLKRPVWILDLRNHGDSPHHPQHDYPSMAEDVKTFIHQHRLEDSTIMGHSMGAKVAMAVALGSPELVQNVIAIDNAPVDVPLFSDSGKYIQVMKKVESAQVKRMDEADKILQEVEPSLVIRQFLLGNLYRPKDSDSRKFRIPLDILGRSLGHMGDFPYHDPDSLRFEKPAQFIRGTQSKYVPDDILPLVGRFFPRFELADIDAGHWVVSEKPAEFLSAVKQFLGPKEQ